MKELVYDLKPVLAVNEGPDYENKNYEEKTLFSGKPWLLQGDSGNFCRLSISINGILSAEERAVSPGCSPVRPMAG